MMSVNLEM